MTHLWSVFSVEVLIFFTLHLSGWQAGAAFRFASGREIDGTGTLCPLCFIDDPSSTLLYFILGAILACRKGSVAQK